MKLIKKGKLEYFVFDLFEKTGFIKHCFSTRNGGVSVGCYDSLNLSFRQDKRENVIKNYEILCDAIKCDSKNTVFSDQIHEDKIYFADKSDCGKGLYKESDIKGYDALVTDVKDVLLVTFYADCVPIFIADIRNKVVALSHSGWKGTVKEISKKTIEAMIEKYGTDKNDIIAGIGPSIGVCCFEVDYPVVEEFKNKLPFSEKYIFKGKENKFFIDLQKINKQILINVGVAEKNIEVADICTKCNPNIFYSHRNMGSERGSLAALMQIY